MAGTRQNRRVIQEDDEDEAKNDESIPDAGGENVAKSSTSSVVDRLKRRAAKAAEAAQMKRAKLQKEEEKQKSPAKSPFKVQTEISIPKKAKKVQTIPKKSVDNASSTNSNSEADNSKRGKPSLLSEMKKPDRPKTDTGNNNSGDTVGNKGKDRSFLSSRPHTNNKNRSVSGSRNSPPHSAPLPPASTPSRRPETIILTNSPEPAEPTPSGPVVEGGKEDKLGSGLRQLVWDGLKDLCKDTFAKPPERNGVDLFASFLRHKDLKPTTTKSGNGSTDAKSNLRYDFFDTDDTTGDIVLQPKIPIFPEEFPQGTREWPLSVSRVREEFDRRNDCCRVFYKFRGGVPFSWQITTPALSALFSLPGNDTLNQLSRFESLFVAVPTNFLIFPNTLISLRISSFLDNYMLSSSSAWS